ALRRCCRGVETTPLSIEVMAFVPTLATVSRSQFDAVLFDPIDGADMNAVRANYFHMLFNTAQSATQSVSVQCSRRSRKALSRSAPESLRQAVQPGSHSVPMPMSALGH